MKQTVVLGLTVPNDLTILNNTHFKVTKKSDYKIRGVKRAEMVNVATLTVNGRHEFVEQLKTF